MQPVNLNPIKRLVTLYKGTAGVERPMTIRHELSHAMEQMMTIGAREAMIREWSKAFQAAIKKHTDAKSQDILSEGTRVLGSSVQGSHGGGYSGYALL
jgi:hypothetical protein